VTPDFESRKTMSDVVDLCDAIEDALGEAPPEARRILAREIDGFWEAFPGMHQWGHERLCAELYLSRHGLD
jgi:hypothetical protein